MPANIEAIRTDADAINNVELTLSGLLFELSFAAEYGQGSTSQAVESLHASGRHAAHAVVAAAAGNAVMAAKHEAQAADADAEAARMLERARTYADELRHGLGGAEGTVAGAVDRARSLVDLDDSSPAAELHVKIASQPETVGATLAQAEEIHRRLSGPRDPAELQAAAEHFGALRYELEEESGRAHGMASDAAQYGDAI